MFGFGVRIGAHRQRRCRKAAPIAIDRQGADAQLPPCVDTDRCSSLPACSCSSWSPRPSWAPSRRQAREGGQGPGDRHDPDRDDRGRDGREGRATYEMTVDGVPGSCRPGRSGTGPLESARGLRRSRSRGAGTYREGSHDLSVATINGTAVRAAGSPPWAGEPKVVGERHPAGRTLRTRRPRPTRARGTAASMRPVRPSSRHGRGRAPGQNKVKTGSDDADDGS